MSSLDRILRFGDGTGGKRNFGCANDVVAHEFMHGVTQFMARFKGSDASRVLNEHYSDIFAAMVDDEDWLLGEDISPTGQPERHLQNPTLKGDPDHYDDRTGSRHGDTGIGNKAFYLLAEGLEVETDTGYRCNASIGRTSAWEAFFYAQNILTNSSKYPDLAVAVPFSAGIVDTLRRYEPDAAQNAFARVGLNDNPARLACAEPWLALMQ